VTNKCWFERLKPPLAGVVAGLSLLAVGSFVEAATPPGNPSPVDFEAAFARTFPGSGTEHRIADWNVYAALATGDVVAYAEKIDPALAKRAEDVRGKPYQSQQLETSIKGDLPLVAAFNEQRRRIKSMVLYADGSGFKADGCQHPLVYVGKEFRLVLGESSDRSDPLSHATIAPSCPQALQSGFQITGGRSSRFMCWDTKLGAACGWRLPDMPAALKGVVESTYPKSIALRWRWRGLGGVVRTRYVDDQGNRVGARDGAALTVPVELTLEFVDEAGHVIWTAPATGPAGKSSGPSGH
jgi:hypothetical protein